MRIPATLTQLIAGCLAIGLGHPAGFAQGIHLDALREWLRNTEEAAKFVEQGDYIKAEQRLGMAIKEIRPYFPDTQREPGSQLLRAGAGALSSETVCRSRAPGSLGPVRSRIGQDSQGRRGISVCVHPRFDPVRTKTA